MIFPGFAATGPEWRKPQRRDSKRAGLCLQTGPADVRKAAPAWLRLWQAALMASDAVEHVSKDPGENGAMAGPARYPRIMLLLTAWSVIAVTFAAQGWWAAMLRGSPQPWWPSLGYSAAIFSVWVVLTEPVVALVMRVERSGLSRGRRLGLYIAGFPAVTACHVWLFAMLYWPLYNDGGRIPSPLAMAERMLVPNAHTNLIFYAGLVLIAVGEAVRERNGGPGRDRIERAHAPVPAPTRLRIRSRGRVRDVEFDEINWIGAAGNYAEIHSSTGAHLIEESLTALAERLPDGLFARIHRRTIVRLQFIREIRSQGRGDALVRLADGTELRLSRRYRAAAAVWLRRE